MEKIICVILLIGHSVLALAQTAESFVARADSFGYQQLDSAVHYWQLGGELALANGQEDLAYKALEKAAGSELFRDNHEYAVNLYRKIYPIAKTNQQKSETLSGLTHQYIYDSDFQPDSLFQQAINYARLAEHDPNIVANLGNYAVYLNLDGRYVEAMSNFLEAIFHHPEPLQKLTLCINISSLFFQLDNVDRAKEYIDEAVKISEEKGYRARDQKVAVNLGRYHLIKGNIAAAEKEFERIIMATTKNRNSSIHEAYLSLADIELTKGNLEKSQSYRQQSVSGKMTDEILLRGRQELLGASIKAAQGKIKQAIAQAEAILLEIPNESVSMVRLATHRFLSTNYENQKKLDKAFFHFKEMKKIEDKLYQINQSIAVYEQEAKYKRKEQATAIAILDQQNQIQSLKLSEKNTIIILGGIALLIFSILSFFLYRYYQQVKEQRNIIKYSLDEKEILLREIHHRVKNNLQMVSSLLSLQSRYIKDEAALEAIKRSKSRVRSMALIHQDLYSHDNLKGVGVKEFLHKLCSELYSAYNISQDEIRLHLNIADINLDVDSMIPIGLIINELVANALKYAFAGRTAGEIKIDLQEEQGQLVLSVADDGIGFDSKEATEKSFGYKLINTLAKRLRGEMSFDHAQGSRVTLRFHKYKIS